MVKLATYGYKYVQIWEISKLKAVELDVLCNHKITFTKFS
jgi:hypothetical protein